jgi:hypothetical protein
MQLDGVTKELNALLPKAEKFHGWGCTDTFMKWLEEQGAQLCFTVWSQ